MQVGLGVAQSLEQELVVPLLGSWVVSRQAEYRQNGELEGIAQLDRHIESEVVNSALGTLHPVQHATSVRVRPSGPANPEARLRGQYLLQLRHERRSSLRFTIHCLGDTMLSL